MANFAALFLRLIVVGIGFFLAALSAGVAWIFLSRLIVPGDFGAVGELELTVTLVIGTIGVSAVLARIAAIPAFAFIAFMEITRRRDWLSYAIAGALLAALSSVAPAASGAAISANGVAVGLACGMIAGLVYWLVAGRSAGAWLPERRRQTPVADPE